MAMKPEKKNRLLSFVYIGIILICILAFVFLLIRYINARKDLEKAQQESKSGFVIQEEKKAPSYLEITYE